MQIIGCLPRADLQYTRDHDRRRLCDLVALIYNASYVGLRVCVRLHSWDRLLERHCSRSDGNYPMIAIDSPLIVSRNPYGQCFYPSWMHLNHIRELRPLSRFRRHSRHHPRYW